MNTKKILAMIVSVAMVVAIIPAFGIVASAAETITVVADRSLYVDGKDKTITTDKTDANLTASDGTGWGLPRNSDTCSSASAAGANRGVVMAFKIDASDFAEGASITKATLNVKIGTVVNNLSTDDSQWVKLGIYPVSSEWTVESTYDEIDALGYNEEGTGTNADYILSDQKINQNKTRSSWNGWATFDRWVTFDITDLLKNKVPDDDGIIEVSYRIQGPAATSIRTAYDDEENKPYISIETEIVAPVTVNYVSGTDIVKTVTESVEVGTPYTPDTTAFIADNTVYTCDAVEAVTVSDGMDPIEVSVTAQPNYRSDKTSMEINGVTYDFAEESLIPNATFDYGTLGWTRYAFSADIVDGQNGFSIIDKKVDSDNVTHTMVLLNSDGSAGSGGAGSLSTKWAVIPGGTYYFAYDEMRDTENNNNGGVVFLNAEDTLVSSVTDANCIYTNYANGVSVTNSKQGFGDNTGADYVLASQTVWNRKEYVFVIPDDATQLGFRIGWTNDIYLDNFELVELTAQAAPTTVTVNFVDENGTEIKTSETVENVYVGGTYTYTPADSMITASDRTNYYTFDEDASTLKIDSLAEQDNVITVVYNTIDFKAVDTPAVNSIVAPSAIYGDSKVYSVVDNTNLVSNPSFETADGDFSIIGWYEGKNGGMYAATSYPGYQYDHGYQVFNGGYNDISYDGVNGSHVVNADYTAQDGEWAFGSKYNDGPGVLCTLLKNIYVGNNKTVYLSYYTKATTGDDALICVSAVSGVNAGYNTNGVTTWISNDGEGGGDYNVDYATDWVKVEQVISTDADTDTVQFYGYWLGGGGDDHPNFMFDNFVAVEVKEVAVPTITPSLGIKDGEFAIDLMFDPDALVDGVTYGIKVTGLEGEEIATVDLGDGNVGFTFEANPFRTYKAAVTLNGVAGDPVLVKSIYEMAIEEVATGVYNSENPITETNLALINALIQKGGNVQANVEGDVQQEIFNTDGTLNEIATAAGLTYTASEEAAE